MELLQSRINEAADEIIGKPFKHMGRGPDFYDCMGAVIHIYNRTGRLLPDVVAPAQIEHDKVDVIEDVLPTYDELFEAVGPPYQPLDIPTMRLPGHPNHVFVILDREFALHATREHGVCRVRYKPLMKSGRVLRVYRAKS